MMARRYTAEELIAVPCSAWHDRIRDEAPPEGITAREILKRVDPWEARWPLIKLLARADRRQLVLWCCDVASDVRHLITDEEARDAADVAIQTAVAWTEGAATQDDCRAAAYPAYPADDADDDDADDDADADYDANAACAAYAAYAAADVAAYAADVAAYAVEAAVSAAAYAANAAAGSADDARKDALHGYLHWLVDRLEDIVPEHTDAAAKARAECARASAITRAQAD